ALSAVSALAIVGGFAGALWQLGKANEARARADERVAGLLQEQARIRGDLQESQLQTADLMLQAGADSAAEDLLWRIHLTRPDDDDQRAYHRLEELCRRRGEPLAG